MTGLSKPSLVSVSKEEVPNRFYVPCASEPTQRFMLTVFLQNFALILFLHQSVSESRDLLHLFRPKPDLPQELNDFLTDVQHHKKDFAFIRNVAKNRKNYERSFEENHQMFVEDLDNQMTINPNYNKGSDEYNDRQPDQEDLFSEYNSHQHNLLSRYPGERYSKFLHSPVRLRRELEENYLNQRVQVNRNGQFGNVRRSEPKYPGSKFRDDENRYHTGHVVGLGAADYYHPAKKKKREVEISIKSDGRLLKRIQANDETPKSIILSIKSSDPKLSGEGPPSSPAAPGELAAASVQPDQQLDDLNNGPSNSKTIPSLRNSKKIGVPISRRLISGPLKLPRPGNDEENPNNRQNNKETAQNIDGKRQFELDSDSMENKNDEFEKVQGLVLDNTNVDPNGKPNGKYSKRQSARRRQKLNVATRDRAVDEVLRGQSVDYSGPIDENVQGSNEFDMYQNGMHHIGGTENGLLIPFDSGHSDIKQEEDAAMGLAIAENMGQNENAESTFENDDVTTELIVINQQKITGNRIENEDNVGKIGRAHDKTKKRGARSSKNDKKKDKKAKANKTDENALRNRKHLPTLPKYKRKRIRQHPKKRVDRTSGATSLADLYEGPQDQFDFIPSYRQRQLKSAEYEFDPDLIQDVGNYEKKEIDKLKKFGLRKKLKSEGDYSEEEDPMTSSPAKNVPIKKTRNRFAMGRDATTESNDDDYDYSDFDDMEDDEDITYEEEEAKEDNADIEEPAGSNNKNDHQNDRLYSKVATTTASNAVKLEHSGPASSTDVQDVGLEKIDKVLLEANELLASAHAHGRGAPKPKINKKKPAKREPNAENDVNSQALTRANRAKRRRRKKRVKSSPNEVVNADPKPEEPLKFRNADDVKVPSQFEDKPLSNQQRQDLFLRYNPEFQRWPRFIQSDNKYHELMRRRALENQRRYLRNSADNFPISNEYFLNPKAEFVKREEPATATAPNNETTAAATTSEASEGQTSQVSVAISEGSPGVGEASATLPQSAEKILQTANSDIFENTTAFGVMGQIGALDLGNALCALGGNTATASTRFEFTTNSGDLTENTQCDTSTHKEELMTPCPEEIANHSPVTITSVLPLIKESVTVAKVNISRDEFLDLNDIVIGSLPKHIVSEALTNAKGSVRHGLRSGKFNMNLLLSNQNSSAETNMILNEMTNLMMKLKYHTTCQVLPPNLMIYVKTITKNEMDDPMTKLKEMNDIDFDEHQSNYVFQSGDSNKMQDKAIVLKELLNKYNNLPEHCKERAEPVKEYIESHLAMIDRMSGKSHSKPPLEATVASQHETLVANSTSKPKEKKEIRMSNEDILQNQMMEEGLGNQNPNANEAIEDRARKNRRDAGDVGPISSSTSPQYGRLAVAVRNMKNKRQIMKRIGEIYGKVKREEGGGGRSNGRRLYGNGEKGFEAPRVINF